MSCSDTIGTLRFDRFPRRITLVFPLRAFIRRRLWLWVAAISNHLIFSALNRRFAVVCLFLSRCVLFSAFFYSLLNWTNNLTYSRADVVFSQLVYLFRKIVGSLHGERNCFSRKSGLSTQKEIPLTRI